MTRTAALLGAAVMLAAGAGAASAASSAWDQTDFSEARLIAAGDTVGNGETVRLGLQFRLEPGWKMYWRVPGDAGGPPIPDWTGSQNLAAMAMQWPAPRRFLEEAGLESYGYVNEVVFPLVATLERPGEPLAVRARVDYQVCERICIPVAADLSLDLDAGAGAGTVFARLIERFAATVPRPPAAVGVDIVEVGSAGTGADGSLVVVARASPPFADPDLFVEGPKAFRFTAPKVSLRDGGAEAVIRIPAAGEGDLAGQELGFTLVDGDRAAEWRAAPAAMALAEFPADGASGTALLLPMLGLALLGGLILNLMPCVLPVLSIKLLGVVGHGGGQRRRVAASFLASAAGIVASFLVLAGGAIALKLSGQAVGWGMQFQEPLFLVFLILVLTLFAANLFGLYEISLPSWLGRLASHQGGQGSLGGHFGTGVFATLLATPCTAPFLGTAISFALAHGPGEILLIFAALGLGMAAPYLAVAAVPGLATRMPRPGPWMLWVRRVMGGLLVLTALWLLSVIAVQRAAEIALLIALVMVAIAIVIALTRNRSGAERGAGVAAIAVLALVAFLLPAQVTAPVADDGAAPLAERDWQPFDEAAITELVGDGKVVFVDVTADWCVTCQVNKALVIDRGEVARRLAEPEIVAMRADWTSPDPRIADFLAAFGRYGIPFNVVFGPGAPDGVTLPELLTRGEVLAALDQAAGAVTASR